ncbi:MAG: mechanosensitive ion channel [Clostridia bacterium]|nr:mechanosensitive ion channel [Clostridia bacterium]
MLDVLMGTADGIDKNAIEKFISELPEKALRFGVKVLLALVVFVVGVWLIRLIRKIIHKAFNRANADKGVAQFTESFARIALYAVLIMLIATSFGVDTASVVAVLGSAGVAIGLALQGSLSNFAGGILILLIKPFVNGDYIVACGEEGTVTNIDMCYTKLTTADERIVVLPNGTLANTTIVNNTATPNRRVDFTVSIAYNTDIKLAKELILGVINNEEVILKEQEKVVYVSELAAHSIDLGVRFFTKNADYLSSKGKVLEKIKEAFDSNNIEIPYQQLDVHMK